MSKLNWVIKSVSDQETVFVQVTKDGKEIGKARIEYNDARPAALIDYKPISEKTIKIKLPSWIMKPGILALGLIIGAILDYLARR